MQIYYYKVVVMEEAEGGGEVVFIQQIITCEMNEMNNFDGK